MRILDVVVGRAVAVVVGVIVLAPPLDGWVRNCGGGRVVGSGVVQRMSSDECSRRSCRRSACAPAHTCQSAGVVGIADQSARAVAVPTARSAVYSDARRNLVLPRPHVELTDHAHLQMLGRRDVAMPEVSAGIGRQVVVGEAAADVDGDRRVRHAVVERGRVRVAVKVDRVLLEQVGPHDHADVGQRQEQFVVLVDRDQRRRLVGVHDADVHDGARHRHGRRAACPGRPR